MSQEGQPIRPPLYSRMAGQLDPKLFGSSYAPVSQEEKDWGTRCNFKIALLGFVTQIPTSCKAVCTKKQLTFSAFKMVKEAVKSAQQMCSLFTC
jgi:hypothetical protein